MDSNRWAARRQAFRVMHESGCFVLPNAWDAGSAVRLEALGFRAVASTSIGLAWSAGRGDYEMTRDEVLGHLRALCVATSLPVNADFENAFARHPDDVGRNVALAVETGVAGLSVEDRDGPELLPLGLAVERVAAARAAIDASGSGVVLVARTEGLAMKLEPIGQAVARLRAFADAGADCLYAIGLPTIDDVDAAVRAVAPKPLNVMLGSFKVADLASAGVRRVSTAGALARAAWRGFHEAASGLAEEDQALRR